MELHAIAIRVLFAWILLMVFVRLSGKESVSQLSGRTLVLALILSDLIDDIALGAVSAATFTVAAGAVIFTRSLISLTAVYSDRVYALIEGDPPILLRSGLMEQRALRRVRVNHKELEELLRIQGIDRAQFAELQAVRLEREGKTSAIRHPWARPLRRVDLEGEAVTT